MIPYKYSLNRGNVVQIKRIYEKPAKSDGYRILVDRLWPRGVSKQKAAIDEWNKNVAPSNDLRVWFGHRPDRFDEFSARYKAELKVNPELDKLRQLAKQKPAITLLYAARDSKVNHALVLLDLIK